MNVALRRFCRIVCFLCPLYVLSDGFPDFFSFLQCIVCCSRGMEWNKQRLVGTLYPRGLWWKLEGCPTFSPVLMRLVFWWLHIFTMLFRSHLLCLFWREHHRPLLSFAVARCIKSRSTSYLSHVSEKALVCITFPSFEATQAFLEMLVLPAEKHLTQTSFRWWIFTE